MFRKDRTCVDGAVIMTGVLISACSSDTVHAQAIDIAWGNYKYKDPVEVGRSDVSSEIELAGCTHEDDLVIFVQDGDINAFSVIVCFDGDVLTSHKQTAG